MEILIHSEKMTNIDEMICPIPLLTQSISCRRKR